MQKTSHSKSIHVSCYIEKGLRLKSTTEKPVLFKHRKSNIET